MYVVTFYSYKGGVGRSMALVNVAALLAEAGKRVLLVDFDLEAPGLPSYGPLGCAMGLPGIVDYVEEYRRALKSPDAERFIVECSLPGGEPIWTMPAGDNRSPAYTERLGAIDWDELYEGELGFFMFEDLRQQWENHPADFDYVLIDSRTGHTDVGGICTRQLPDAVVAMFVPTEQNIVGLAPIVAGVRQASRPGGKPIRLHFCASNVPDEYDEEGVLETRMKSAREQLAYGMQAGMEPPQAIIHHRTSLQLLDQGLIVLDRPKSKLAKEFRDLKTNIVGENLADREGAMVMLDRLPRVYEKARTRPNGRQVLTEISDRAREARRLHPEDGPVAVAAANVFSMLGEYEEELASLSTAIASGEKSDSSRLRRAGVLLKGGRNAEALEDLRTIFTSPTSTIFEMLPATKLLRSATDDVIAEASSLMRRPDTKVRVKIELAQQLLMSDRSNMSLVADEMKRMIEYADMSEDLLGDVRNVAQLAFISTGDFDSAITAGTEPGSVPDLFNHAVACWGKTGSPPLEEFRRIDELPRSLGGDANEHQCFALIKDTLGDADGAHRELEAAAERIQPKAKHFSCWTYLYGTGEELLRDVREMQTRLQNGERLKPPFLAVEGALKGG